MKKFLPLILACALTFALASPFLTAPPGKAEAGIKVFLEDKLLVFDVPPQLINGRVMVPMRGIFTALQADIKWDAAKRAVTATKGNTQFLLTIDRKTAAKNGRELTLDAAPTIINGRTMVPLRFVGEALGLTVDWQAKSQTVFIKKLAVNLPLVGSEENLRNVLAKAVNFDNLQYRHALKSAPATTGALPSVAENSASAADQTAKEYSTTNVQVLGVDEADIVKTDGNYIYQVNNRRVMVTKASPPAEMKNVSMLDFNKEKFVPQEMYVDAKHLVIIGSSYEDVPVMLPQPAEPVSPKIYPPPFFTRSTVKAIIYDLSDKANLKRLRDVELEGNYVSSRKIGNNLYFVANKNIDYYIMQQPKAVLSPAYRDSAGTGKFTAISFDNIRYFPDSVAPNYLLVAGINLDRADAAADISTYLGAGQNIYASAQNLYVAVTRYAAADETANNPAAIMPRPAGQNNTQVYKFALNQGKVDYQGKGEVPGIILNQFSMDEHKGYFRIATTKGEVWRNDENTSRNNVYILDNNLKTAGKIEDIAPGEKIYSVRFMGDRGYMVTFKTVDPLFVIDLKDPQAPKILGALKIPGYSDYLHPYDENHIIGFGKDTVEMTPKNPGDRDAGPVAFYQGMKIAVFDVSDVHNPKEKFTEKIGDRGTDSELLRNHKALLFAKDKNLLAFPVTVMEVKNKSAADNIPAYGEFTFQGAYIYNLDLVKGFSLKGKITHLTAEDYKKAGTYWPGSDKNVERIIYIGDTLYTLSQTKIKAHQLPDLKETGSLQI